MREPQSTRRWLRTGKPRVQSREWQLEGQGFRCNTAANFALLFLLFPSDNRHSTIAPYHLQPRQGSYIITFLVFKLLAATPIGRWMCTLYEPKGLSCSRKQGHFKPVNVLDHYWRTLSLKTISKELHRTDIFDTTQHPLSHSRHPSPFKTTILT